jgi:hypothetical protein
MLPDHIFAVGTTSDYTPGSCMSLDSPHLLSRTFLEERRVVVNDCIEMGAKDMLEAAGPHVGSRESQDVFVRGRNPADGKLIRVNLERDHVPQAEGDLRISAEIDSFIFVGEQIRVKGSVKVYVTTCVNRDPPIRHHNHVYVELLLPPTLEERMDGRPSYLEKEFGLSQIPHMRFADLGEGVNVYVFFPRAIHNKRNSRFKDANVSFLDQRLFLERVVLPALQKNVPFTDMSRYGYDADGFNQKTATQTHTTGRKGIPKGLSVKLDAFHGMQESMREILNRDLDGELAQYGSFFFVLEGKGVGLGLVVEDMTVSAPTQPLQNLSEHFTKIDFGFILDRDNGEAYFDVALTVSPKSSLVGLWRLEPLEASFGAGGFLSGKVFPLNTMAWHGSLQAEMGRKRRGQTHIASRSSYLSIYNLARNFDNQAWAPSDAEAYHFSSDCSRFWNTRMTEYTKAIQRGTGYGVRDEYRIGGQALDTFLNSALEKVQEIFLLKMIWHTH